MMIFFSNYSKYCSLKLTCIAFNYPTKKKTTQPIIIQTYEHFGNKTYHTELVKAAKVNLPQRKVAIESNLQK